MNSALKKTPKSTVSSRMPDEVHARVPALTKTLDIEADSTTYRWIVEAFLEIVDDEKEEPTMPSILDLCRNRWKVSKFSK